MSTQKPAHEHSYQHHLLFSRQVVSNSSVTPRTVAHQAPLSLGFPRQEYWGGLPFPSPGDQGIVPTQGGTRVSCIGMWVLYCLASREALTALYIASKRKQPKYSSADKQINKMWYTHTRFVHFIVYKSQPNKRMVNNNKKCGISMSGILFGQRRLRY